MKKYLLSKNQKNSNEQITNVKSRIDAGKHFISLINPLGFETFESWEAINHKLNEPYPKATLLFNLTAQGIEQQYSEAKTYFDKHGSIFRFEPLTELELQEIKEDAKLYTVNDKQAEAYEALQRIAADLSTLKNLGLDLDFIAFRKVHRLFEFDHRSNPAITISSREMEYIIPRLK